MQKKLDAINNTENKLLASFDKIQNSEFTNSSTPILLKSQNNSLSSFQTSIISSSISSSTPSGASEIIKIIGDEWQITSSEELNVSPKNISSNNEQIECSNKVIENERREYHANSALKENIEEISDTNTNKHKDNNLNNLLSSITINETNSNKQTSNVSKLNSSINSNIVTNNRYENESSSYIPSSITISETSCNIGQISNESINLNFSINNDAPPIDIRDVYVPVSKNETANYSRKQYFCPYCKKLQTKFARHLELKHKSIPDVQKFIHFPKGNLERHRIIEKIRKYGNYLHNTDANLNTGILIACRRPQAKFQNTADDYVCCSHCKGFFSKRTLRIHYKKCNPTYEKGRKDQLVKGKQLMGYVQCYANEVMRRKIIPSFQDDKVSRSIKYDELIILFGNKLCNTYTLSHQHDMIRNYLRLLGRFKLTIKEINENISDFASIFQPGYYDDVIKAVKICANYNSESQIFQTPYNATTLGTMIKKCARIQAAEFIKRKNFDGKKALDDFMVLFDDDFSVTINKKVAEDRANKSRTKQIILPSKSDIQKLHIYSKNICEKAIKILQKRFNLNAWTKLTEGTLILLQLFNRRRAGELERLTIENYKNQETIDSVVSTDIFDNISEDSQKQAKQFIRLTIRGKRGRTVPLLLHTFLISYIDVLLKYRTEAGVSSKNKYIFAVPRVSSPKKGYVRVCPIMRKFATDCGAEIPTSLRGTMLRKHLATYIAMMRIEENQVSDLANFMGHDKQIHKDVYRVPNGLIDMTEVSRLLQAAIGNNNENEDNNKENDQTDQSSVSDIFLN